MTATGDERLRDEQKTGAKVPINTEMVTLTIDDVELSVPKGTLVIRAAELIGIQIPRFCDHPLLDPVGACRQCLVEVEGQRKPMASCTTVATDGMVVRTQLTSEVADKAQQGVMEFLLINHPLDCPVCDKGGECPLQNQAMSNGRADSRFEDVKRTFPKPINISSQVLLDRERCVLCARCTRFSEQIAGDPFIELLERGALQQVGIYTKEPFDSYFSGNTVQICPVGALTGMAYRFRARPFDLVSSPSVCEHCASGCAQRTDHRRGAVMRRLAGDEPEVNEEWNCDKGRWAFTYATESDRINTPLIRGDDGELAVASWSEALTVAAKGLSAAYGNAGVLVGGRATLEDAYAYAKFARVVLGSNDIDFRARAYSAEEADFLAARVAGQPMAVTYADLEAAPVVLLAGFEPEEESPIVYLRLRKAARKNHAKIYKIAPFATRGLTNMSGTLLQTMPGGEGAKLDELATGEFAEILGAPGAVIMVGERLATAPGALSAAIRLAEATGARLAWVPRRAGECGAVEAGALFSLLPGGRPVADPEARSQVCAVWNVTGLPTTTGPRNRRNHHGCRRIGCADGGRGRACRPAGPGRCGCRNGFCAVRCQPGVAAQRRHRTRRRDFSGGTGCRKGGHVRQLGGTAPALRTVVAQHRHLRRHAGAGHDRRRDGRGISAFPTQSPPATSSLASDRGKARGLRLRLFRPVRWPSPRRVKRCWRVGECCLTQDACRTVSRTSPVPRAVRWRGCRRPPPARSARRKAIW